MLSHIANIHTNEKTIRSSDFYYDELLFAALLYAMSILGGRPGVNDSKMITTRREAKKSQNMNKKVLYILFYFALWLNEKNTVEYTEHSCLTDLLLLCFCSSEFGLRIVCLFFRRRRRYLYLCNPMEMTWSSATEMELQKRDHWHLRLCRLSETRLMRTLRNLIVWLRSLIFTYHSKKI